MALPPPIVAYLKSVRGTPAANEIMNLLGTTHKGAGAHPTRHKGAPPYWIKSIKSVNPEVRTGYGIEGDFLNGDAYLTHVKDGDYFLFQHKASDGSPILHLLRKTGTVGDAVTITFPSGREKLLAWCVLDRIFTSYEDAINYLVNIGTPVDRTRGMLPKKTA